MRLRHLDSANKSKAIIDVNWSKLRGNKEAYLSVAIKQIVVNGETIHNWQEQKQALKNLNEDLHFLSQQHLSRRSCPLDIDSEVSNIKNKLDSYLKQRWEKLPIYEELQDSLKESKNTLYKSELIKTLNKSVNATAKALSFYVLDDIIDSDSFQYKDLEKSKTHYNQQIIKTINCFGRKEFNILESYWVKLKEYQALYKKINHYSFKSIKRSEILTLEKLVDSTGLEENQIKDLAFSYNTHGAIKNLISTPLENKYKNIKIKLELLTEKYNINTVNG